MARKSRESMAAKKQESIVLSERCYKTAIYARLSDEDGNKKTEGTLETQIELAHAYIKEQSDMQFCRVFQDNGFTGTNFDRPGFTEMMEQVRSGLIDCIVVKDLSRLGRNYVETGNYIEQIFPFLGVRFVAVTDGFDTMNIKSTDDLIAGLKNLINAVYAKDISRKILTSVDTKQKNGEFIGMVAPYGYLKSPEDKHKFVVDEAVAPVVRQIFAWRMEGHGGDKIAYMLNQQGVLSPRAYRYSIGVTKSDRYRDSKWGRSAIYTILRNREYTGCIVQGKNRQELCNNIKAHSTDESDWIVVENCHESIIEKSVFEQVQQLDQERRKKYQEAVANSDIVKEENLLKGFVRCGDCGAAAKLVQERRKGRDEERFYVCTQYRTVRGIACSNKFRYDKHEIENAVFETIKAHLKLFADCDVAEQKYQDPERKNQQKQKKELRLLDMEIGKLNQRLSSLYSDLDDGILSVEECEQYKADYRIQLKNCLAKKESLLEHMAGIEKKQDAKSAFMEKVNRCRKAKRLTGEMVEIFVKCIQLNDNDAINIQFNFMDELEEMKKGGEVNA